MVCGSTMEVVSPFLDATEFKVFLVRVLGPGNLFLLLVELVEFHRSHPMLLSSGTVSSGQGADVPGPHAR
jgi:hypothetical protein